MRRLFLLRMRMKRMIMWLVIILIQMAFTLPSILLCHPNPFLCETCLHYCLYTYPVRYRYILESHVQKALVHFKICTLQLINMKFPIENELISLNRLHQFIPPKIVSYSKNYHFFAKLSAIKEHLSH